jgi:glycosyltransferase involved in cell wall biosynthesis
MSEPLVSFILPILNSASTISLALESVLHQTAPGLEILVVDDGSRDQSTTRLRARADRLAHLRFL